MDTFICISMILQVRVKQYLLLYPFALRNDKKEEWRYEQNTVLFIYFRQV